MFRQPLIPDNRGAMTPARKARIWRREKGVCWMCGQPVAEFGPDVVYDHKLPLDLGGTDHNDNIFPLHTKPCNVLKTKADAARIVKARRIRKKAAKPKAPGSIKSRGFDKSKTKGFDGKVRTRT